MKYDPITSAQDGQAVVTTSNERGGGLYAAQAGLQRAVRGQCCINHISTLRAETGLSLRSAPRSAVPDNAAVGNPVVTNLQHPTIN
jgi:hypothetical protein